MKTIKYILAGVFIITFLVSCDTYYDGYAYRRNPNRYDNSYYYNGREYKKLPPGQAKKIYGGSAKDYAPGQRKKYYRYDD
ncbi:hypothetical protein [Elizabethkingia ursingii]|uniref:hypothetical protein n=1 Tax=Elizabethkingia ursingii TaxID=1756150 RepID=UPI000750C70C|nr:hypothetical protein [Elizabethkingia ursingii]KUY31366.1 hypothetical protein ATB96_10785 [Elizabethkingia ursingii]